MLTLGLGLTLAAIGLIGSFISGLLGVGGAIFIIPMLLYIPRLVGTGALTMKECAGLSIVLVFVGSFSGALANRKLPSYSTLCVKVLAPATALGAVVGGVGSRWVSADFLSGVFACMALVAGLLMFRRKTPAGEELPPGTTVRFAVVPGILIAGGVGLLAGLVGAGGA
ncbi:MAG TPA: sulfite exporter TauE/SafE family protein, partial [Symbiobacteriaceae bacterium]|nr:sulfite exporter TauE/SafE family protein [Symbiobacteriaceae bacterium]